MIERLPAIVLAAGFGRRWNGPGNKLLHEFDGVPVLRRTVQALRAGGIGHLYIVHRESHQPALAIALEGLSELCWIENAAAEAGMGTSVAIGARSLPVGIAARGFAISPGDLPSLRPEEVSGTAADFLSNGGKYPVRPTYQGQPGHPVFFPETWRTRLATLGGDVGARELLEHSQCRCREANHPGVVADFDQRAT